MATELNALESRAWISTFSVTVEEAAIMLKKLYLKRDRRDSFYEQVVEASTEKEMKRWVNTESYHDIIKALVNDCTEDSVFPKSIGAERCYDGSNEEDVIEETKRPFTRQ